MSVKPSMRTATQVTVEAPETTIIDRRRFLTGLVFGLAAAAGASRLGAIGEARAASPQSGDVAIPGDPGNDRSPAPASDDDLYREAGYPGDSYDDDDGIYFEFGGSGHRRRRRLRWRCLNERRFRRRNRRLCRRVLRGRRYYEDEDYYY